MKNNRPMQTSIEKEAFSEFSEDNNFVQWLVDNGRNLSFAFLAVIALFVVGYRISFGSMVKSETNYINAENDYQRFNSEKNSETQQKYLSSLNSIMASHPELYAKYDGLIAQKLIADENYTESLPFATRAIDRTKNENAPLYSDYSLTTLLIAETNYQEALKKSLNLKALILKESENETSSIKKTADLLFAFNLLRIGMLQQQLQLEKDELVTWNEWKTAKINDETIKKLINNFNVGQISLINYIEAREKILRKS